MKWNMSRKWVAAIFVLAACIPIPWWREFPAIKMLSMGMLIVGMTALRGPRGNSAQSQPEENPAADRRTLAKRIALLGLTFALSAVAFLVLKHADAAGWRTPWPVYFFAGAVGAFFWSVSGFLMPMRR